MRPALRLAVPFLALSVFPWPCLAAATPALHLYEAVALSSDGTRIASIERDDGSPDTTLAIRGLDASHHPVRHPVLASCAPDPACEPASPTWNADGTRLAFLVTQPDGTSTIETVGAAGGHATTLLRFDGPLDTLRYGPHDQLAVLATANAHKRVGATQAAAPMEGEIGTEIDEQRIAILDGARLRFVSPPDLYVYEYDWRPDGSFAGTAAPGNGDSDWWIARLYAFDKAGPRILFTPGPREQLADPVVSPDGRTVAFVGGWMSDFGSTGGDAYLLPLDHHASPVDLTPDTHATVTALDWHCRDRDGGGLTATGLAGPDTTLLALSPNEAPRTLWSGAVSLSAGGWNMSLACAGGRTAAIRQSFTSSPALLAGPIGAWRTLTHDNDALASPATARPIAWTDDGNQVSGWLLEPSGAASGQRRPLIVDVHGGPQAAATPEFPRGEGLLRAELAAGWDVLMPNYRGSFGGGERFAQGSIGDIGGGDWRDVLTGLDAAERAAPIDPSRVAIEGGSYGGYMAMWAVTQTHRFAAAAADAGVSDWLSIEGEAPQAGSDEVSFGGSVYDDPGPYLRASPVMHMRDVRTPTLVTVGDRDVECPMPQSEEFYRALAALHVPVSFVVYKDEGHGFTRPADTADLHRRTLAWFRRAFAAAKG